MEKVGKIMVIVGVVIAVAGVVVWLLGDKLRFLGRLPGDIRIEKENYSIYIPVTTMVLVSILLSLVVWVVQRLGK